MAKLDGKHKRFIVVSLAYYETPSQVAAAVKEEFNVVVTRQQVAFFDPTTRQSGNKKPSKELVDLFTQTRTKLDAEIDSIPIAKQAYRLLAIQRAFRGAEASNNKVLALQALKQAAEEIGGVYTNLRKLSGGGVGTHPIAVENVQSGLTHFYGGLVADKPATDA